MNVGLVLAAAAADWARLGPLIDPVAEPRLHEPLRRLRALAAESEEWAVAAHEVARLVLELLPPDEAEALVDAARAGRFAGSGHRTWAGFAAADLAVLVLDRHPMVGPVLGPIRDRLLGFPALNAPWVAEHAGTAHLVRLRAEGGREQLPRFQFEDEFSPWPVVLEVNAILDAERDPWGVADWWLSANAYLGEPPADLLGCGRDGQLVGTARYVVEGD